MRIKGCYLGGRARLTNHRYSHIQAAAFVSLVSTAWKLPVDVEAEGTARLGTNTHQMLECQSLKAEGGGKDVGHVRVYV